MSRLPPIELKIILPKRPTWLCEIPNLPRLSDLIPSTPRPWKCTMCGCTRSATSEIRRGPQGAHTLCNACGLHWAKDQRNKLEGEKRRLEAARVLCLLGEMK